MKPLEWIYVLGILWLFPSDVYSQSNSTPFQVEELFDRAENGTLGLRRIPGAETYTIFIPADSGSNTYHHGLVLLPFKNALYAQWQSSAKDEDASDTRVYYSKSVDGRHWSAPRVLSESWQNGIITPGGWWSYGDTLVAYLSFWPQNLTPRGGYTKYRLSTDGEEWTEALPVLDQNGDPLRGVIEQDIHGLNSGRLLTAFHLQPGLQAYPHFTDHPLGTRGWTRGQVPEWEMLKDMTRGIEPSSFQRKDGTLVMIFRDQKSSFKKLAAVSRDEGITWSRQFLVDTPDSRSKQSAGNLPDGTAYMVNNPSGSKDRFPLAITLSDDGTIFDRAYLIRGGDGDLPELLFEGKYKRKGFSYPKSVIWGEYLYVGYCTNKEVVQLTRLPLRSLMK